MTGSHSSGIVAACCPIINEMGSRVPGQRPVILVADDEAMVRQVLTELLVDEGYQVLTASDGDEALQLAREGHPDLILLDLRMPKLDGAACCRAYRDTGGQAPVILLTAVTERIATTKLGADDYLAKPFEVDILLAMIARHLRLHL